PAREAPRCAEPRCASLPLQEVDEEVLERPAPRAQLEQRPAGGDARARELRRHLLADAAGLLVARPLLVREVREQRAVVGALDREPADAAHPIDQSRERGFLAARAE